MLKTAIFISILIIFLFIIYKAYKLICDNIEFEESNDPDQSKVIQEQIDAYKLAGQLQEAFNIAKNYLNHQPRNEMARLIYAKLLYDVEKYYDAIGHLNIILRSNPNNFDASILIGGCYNKTKQYSKAINSYKYVIEKDKTNIKALTKLAEIYVFRKDKKSAVPLYKRLIELAQDKDENEKKRLQMILTHLYFDLKDWPNLIDEANQIKESYPNDQNILFYLKKAYLICDDTDNAIDVIKRLIELDPYNIKHQEDLISLSYKAKDYDSVIEYSNELAKMRNSNKSFTNNNIANAYIQKKEYSAALEFIKGALRYNPKDTDLKKTLADLYCLMNDFDEAISIYEEIVEDAIPREVEDLMLEMSDIYFKQGNKFMEEDNPNDAFEKYTKAIEYNPENPELFFALAEMNVKIKNYSEAIKYYKSAIELDPKAGTYYLRLANAYYELDNILDAKKCYNEAILIEPELTLGYVSLGLIYVKQENYENAISYFSKALDIEPLNVDIRYNLALAYEHSLNNAKAIKEYKKVLEIDPNHVESKNNLDLILKFNL